MHNQLCYILEGCEHLLLLCAVLIPPAFYCVHLSGLFFYVMDLLDAAIIITVHASNKVSTLELQ